MFPLRQYHLIILIILLGFGVRVHDLQAVPMRGDEAFSAQYWADLPLSVSLFQIAHRDPHPPLASFCFACGATLSAGIDSVFALRLLSTLGNTIGIPAIFVLGWRLAGKRSAGLLAAILWALHPYEIWHSQDFRNYAVWAGFSVTSLWLGLRLVDCRRRADWLLYGLAATSTGLIFYTEVFIMVAVASFAILTQRRDARFLRRFLSVHFVAGTFVMLAFLLLQLKPDTLGSYSGNLEAFSAGDYLTRFLPVLLMGENSPLDLPRVGLFFSVVIVLASALVYRSSKRKFAFLVLLVSLPLALLGLVSLSRNVFSPRYVLATVPALILLLALGSFHAASYLRRVLKLSRSVLALCILAPWYVLAGISLHAYFSDPSFRKAPAWDELGAFLNRRVSEEDLVIQLSADAAFGYYYRGAAADIALPESPTQSADEIVARLESLPDAFESIYVVSREIAGWPNAGVVGAWMKSNVQEVLLTDTAGLPVHQYMKWSVVDPFEATLARFDDSIDLIGYEFFEDPLPTGELLLWVYWRPLSRTEYPLKSFVHVYSEANLFPASALWTQDDQYAQRGRLDSTTWPLDDIFRDVYYLPANELTDGTYQIKVGWYEPASGARLLLSDGSDTFSLHSYQYSA